MNRLLNSFDREKKLMMITILLNLLIEPINNGPFSYVWHVNYDLARNIDTTCHYSLLPFVKFVFVHVCVCVYGLYQTSAVYLSCLLQG